MSVVVGDVPSEPPPPPATSTVDTVHAARGTHSSPTPAPNADASMASAPPSTVVRVAISTR